MADEDSTASLFPYLDEWLPVQMTEQDEFGGRCVQVRGADKLMLHLMFGIIALFADQLLKVTGC